MSNVPLALLSNHPVLGSITKDQLDRIEKGAWYHSIDLPDGRVIPGIISVEALRARMDAFGLPADLRGKRFADWTRGVIQAALRDGQLAAAGASLGIQAVQCARLLLRGDRSAGCEPERRGQPGAASKTGADHDLQYSHRGNYGG